MLKLFYNWIFAKEYHKNYYNQTFVIGTNEKTFIQLRMEKDLCPKMALDFYNYFDNLKINSRS